MSNFRFSAVFLSLLFCTISLYAQSTVSPEVRRQMQSATPAQQQIMNRYLANPSSITPAQQQMIDRYMADPNNRSGFGSESAQSAAARAGMFEASDLSDSVFLRANEISDTAAREFSVYEKMFRGKDIIPDSLISSLTMFGYDVFSQTRVHSFSPGDMSNVPVSYPVRAGDEVKIHLWGRVNEEHLIRVTREGTLNVPRIGPIRVAGQPFGTMERTLTQRLQNIEGVNVAVSMGELRPIGIYIVGEVNSPGFHTVSPLTNVTNALFTAGGITNRGSLRSVQLKRGGKLVTEVDFYDFLISGNDKTGLRLQAGDVIVVPVARQMVAVVGNVRRSAMYELKQPTKLSEVLEIAGGVTASGWKNRIQVERFEGNNRQIIFDVDSSRMALPDVIIKDGDIVRVFPVLDKGKNSVFLSGNVMRPGKYEFRSGMRIRDVINDHHDLLPESYFEYAVVLRKTFPSFLERIVPFSLQNALSDAASADNIVLEEQDEIIIYPQDYFTPDRTVSVDGSVTTPGTYRILDNMTIRDLILQAGGLTDDASRQRGELYRRVERDGAVVFNKIEFSVEKVMAADPQQNVILNKSDRIFVRSMKGWQQERRVTLRGEFFYPGIYVLFEDETLGDLIKRAGGFKEDAYLRASVFTRQSVRNLEQLKQAEYASELEGNMIRLSIELASKGQNIGSLFEQQLRLKEMLDSSTVSGRVLIDMTNKDHYTTFSLEDGDELFVPKVPNTVSVLGEVYNSATFRLDSRRTLVSHYLNLAGGPKRTAERKDMYVIRANGTVISNKEMRIASVHLEPGDVVVVPAKVRYGNPHKIFLDTADAALKITSFLATLVMLAIAINTMNATNNANP
ncbi:MAG: SLBB domain-containing protein [Chitinispirillia bacterium]|nr:SLBB domain-containing protein [Chitinispirillia bacterium]